MSPLKVRSVVGLIPLISTRIWAGAWEHCDERLQTLAKFGLVKRDIVE